MNVREYEAPTLRDGLLQVREELGPDAVILETQKLRRGGVMGIGARDAVRIVAAIETPPPSPGMDKGRVATIPADSSPRRAVVSPSATAGPPRRQGTVRATTPGAGPASVAPATQRPQSEVSSRPPHPRLDRAYARARGQAESSPDPLAGAAEPARALVRERTRACEERGDDRTVERLERELRELRASVESVRGVVLTPASAGAPVPGSTPTHDVGDGELYERLVAADVQPGLARELVEGMPDLGSWDERARRHLGEQVLRELMASRVRASGPIAVAPGSARVVALVGPVGVGKTTTIAKLAAHYALVERRRVALLTMDTYRIAAVDQLRTYSRIIGVPLTVVSNPSEARQAVEDLADCELVLIDTAGRSQKHAMQMAELKALVDATQCEAHLALSSSTKYADMVDQVARFSQARVDRLLFTKLDETTTYGTIYSVAATAGLPVSYLTTGQKVPEDIEDATAAKLASFVLNQRSI